MTVYDPTRLDVVQLLVQECDLRGVEYPSGANNRYGDYHFTDNLDAELIPVLDSTMASPMQTWSSQQRFDFLVRHCSATVTPSMLVKLCPFTKDQSSSVHLRHSDGGCSAFHLVADRLADCVEEASGLERSADWSNLLRRLIEAGVDLHSRGEFPGAHLMLGRYTPFSCILAKYNCFSTTRHRSFLLYWLNKLCTAGVNLAEYGAREASIWRELWPSGVVRSPIGHVRGFRGHKTNFEFTYGQTPEDWALSYQEKRAVPIYKIVDSPGSWPRSQ